MTDDLLTTLLTDAVADVEPHDRLAEIRAGIDRATAQRRTGWVVGGGAILAVAATVAAVALTSTPSSDHAEPLPAGPSPTRSTDDPAIMTEHVRALFLGQTPQGLRLFAEEHFAPVSTVDQRLIEMTRPQDPDYSTFWSADDFPAPVEVNNGVIDVPVSAAVHDRPAGMDQQQAELSLQQAMNTVQDDPRRPKPVQFTLDGNPVDQVFGIPTSEPLDPAPMLDTMSLVQMYTPMEGADVGPSDQINAVGAASSFEANVPWRLMGPNGPVKEGHFTATGSGGDVLYLFTGVIDVSSVKPGTYTLIVFTDDPSGGAEGAGVFSDSRTVVID